MKHTPGPLPSSCLTCRQRRKKCDKTRPICDRCAAGGFRCLGYDHIPSPDATPIPRPSTSKQASNSGRVPSSRKQRNPTTASRIYRDASDVTTDSGTSELGDLSGSSPNMDSHSTPSMTYRRIFPAPSTFVLPPLAGPSRTPTTTFPSPAQSQSTSLALTPPRPRPVFGPSPPPQPSANTNSDANQLQPSTSDNQTSTQFSLFSPLNALTNLGFYNPTSLFTLPPRICPDPMLSGKIIEFIISQYEPLLELVFFRPTPARLDIVRRKMVLRLQSSSLTHWSMYLGARIFQALMRDGKHADLTFLTDCLRRIDEQVCVKSARECTLPGLVNSLSGGLEVIFLDFVTSNTKAGYTLLKKLVPTFLQIAFSDSELWACPPSQCTSTFPSPNGPKLSLAHTLVSPIYELGRFIFMDAISSLTFGVPPLIDYDTSSPYVRPKNSQWRGMCVNEGCGRGVNQHLEADTNRETGTGTSEGCGTNANEQAKQTEPIRSFDWVDDIHPVEWVHGAPAEFTILIVKINLWRAKNPGKNATKDEWEPLEKDAWGWKARLPSTAGPEGEDARQSITRIAIQEGWRHAVLIYLYMGMCGVTSDDSRVQASAKQIVQLLGVLRSDMNTRTHNFVPCLLASICTPNEKHRALLREALDKVENAHPWLFKAMDYKSAVDHLWHGAAAGGQPVKWDDYIDSRRTVLALD